MGSITYLPRYLLFLTVEDLVDHPIGEFRSLAVTGLAAKVDSWITQSVSYYTNQSHVMKESSE